MNRSGLVGAERAAATNEPKMGSTTANSYSVHHQQPLNPSKSLPTLLARNLVVALSKLQEISDEDDQQQQQQQQQVGTQLIMKQPITTASTSSNLNEFTATDKLNEQQLQQQQQLSSATNSIGDWWGDYWSRQPFPSGYTQSSITLIACLLTTIIFLIVVGNLLVCIAIFTEKSLKPTQNWFIASLAVSDMLLGLVVMPFSLARELMGFWIFGPLWCDIHEAIDVLLTTASINTLCLISLDRYWSITQAVSYLKKRTPKRGAFMIAFVWVFSAAVSLPPLFGWKKQSPSIIASNTTATTTTTTTTTTIQPPFADQRSSNNNNQFRDPTDDEWPPVGEQRSTRGGTTNEGSSIVGSESPTSRKVRRQSEELATPILSIHNSHHQHLPSKVSQLLLGSRDDLDGSGGGGGSSLLSSPFQLVDSPGTPLINSIRGSETHRSIAQQQSQLADRASQGNNIPAAVASDQTTEYPSCQLSDDVGYVLYSALGSFYIPCAVMVFTYIKIFLAARSRARRTINKQSRGAGQASGGRRARQNSLLTDKASRRDQSAVSNNITSCGSVLVSPSTVNLQHKQQQQQQQEQPDLIRPGADVVMKGKIVIVERKKSLAAQQPVKSPLEKEVAASTTGSVQVAETSQQQQQQQRALNSSLLTDDEHHNCTLITSNAKQASPNALNSSASNDSSMITVMNASMTDVPVTRFKFQGSEMVLEKSLGGDDDRCSNQSKTTKTSSGTRASASDDGRKAASLLRAISQAGQDEVLKKALSMDSNELPVVPDIVVERRNTSECGPDQAQSQGQLNQGSGTNETCFMTIEEDSDMFDAQTGRTIMMIAGNASQKQANNLAKSQAGSDVMMTMMTVMPPSGQVNNNIVCNNMLCRHSQHLNQGGARSGSSYCGSSMTINDDDLDECNEDELLTDDCNGFSVSCTLDQYCPAGSSCAHCHECERELNNSSSGAATTTANRACSIEGDSTPACKQHSGAVSGNLVGGSNRPDAHLDEGAELEAQSIMGDGDNVSHLTECRSQEDSSSIVGHDVLDATESHHRHHHHHHHGEKKKSIAGQSSELRKMSIIGFRLARLGGGGEQASPEQPSGLIALASSQQQQQQQQLQQHQQPGGTRNLKALRQNFFFKLNQLTGAKSDNKIKKAPSNGKSSAQSSGTSHDNASVDCATTSNVHSTEYHQSTTGGDTDEFEQQNSPDINQQRQVTAKHQIEQPAGALNTIDLPGNNKQACFQQTGDKQTPYKNDDRALLLNSSQANERNGPKRSPSTSSMLVAQTVSNGKRNLDVEKRSGKQVGAITGQLNHSPTILSSNTATGGPVSGTHRAYLASDNERHKRKLAKARERRATLILGLIMTTFISSWSPFFTFYVLRALCNSCREYIPPRFEAFIFWMGYCNSAINPIIYTIFNRDFRKAFRKILFKCL